MKKIIVFLICLISFPIMSYAADCDTDIYEFADNVNINYTITSNENSATFNIYITNLTDDMLLLDTVKGKIYKGFGSNNDRLVVKTTANGKYSLEIYSKKCKTNIRTISVDLPYYNRHYLDSRCKGFENYPLCQRWSTYQANDKTFSEDINKLINDSKKENNEDEKTVQKQKTKWYEFLSWAFIKYWWAFIIILLLIMAIVYVIRANQKKKEYNFKL